MTKLTKNKTKNTTNNVHAICVAAPATPVKPNTPAMSPITKKVIDQLNMLEPSFPNPNRANKLALRL
jgi:hypothetical protein